MFFRIGLPEVMVVLALLLVLGAPTVALVVIISATRRKKPVASGFCTRCGMVLAPVAKFCSRCGAPR